jgi:uncharacterized membrane protein YbhN (UPF0104 family)
MSLLRRHARTLLGAVVSALALVLVVRWALRQPAPSLPTGGGALALLALAVLAYATGMALRGLRWHVVLRDAGVRHPTSDAYGLLAVGFAGNTVLPARGGELLRVLLMARRGHATRRSVLGTVLAERALDLMALAVLFVALTWAGVAGAPAGVAAADLTAGALLVAGAALTGYVLLRRRGRFERFAATIRPVAGAAKLLIRRGGAALAVLSLVIWGIEGAVFLLVGRSLGLDLGYFDAALVVVLASAFAVVPAAPGFAGTFDAGIIIGLTALGVHGAPAVAYVLLIRFLEFVPITVLGLILFLVRYRVAGGQQELGADAPTAREIAAVGQVER